MRWMKKGSNAYDEEKWETYYKIYAWLPLIAAINELVVMFIWGIVDATHKTPTGYYEYSYGALEMPNGFLCWFIWTLIGAVAASIIYFIGNIAISYRIMHIIYLRKLFEKKNNVAVKITKDKKEGKEET